MMMTYSQTQFLRYLIRELYKEMYKNNSGHEVTIDGNSLDEHLIASSPAYKTLNEYIATLWNNV